MFDLKFYLRSRSVSTDPVCEKPTLSAKFEKMIMKSMNAEVTEQPAVLHPPLNLPEFPRSRNTDPWLLDTWSELEEVVREQEQRQQLADDDADEDEDDGPSASAIFPGGLSSVSPFWFLLIGFLLGSGATMVLTYLWLSTTISCLIPRIRRAEAADSADASSQRVSLLR